MHDAIIVGQGIAGSVLALMCKKNGLNVVVVDDGHKTSSSMVSAGIMTPLTGPRLSPLWTSEHTRDLVMGVYADAEEELQVSFIRSCRLVRLLESERELEFLKKRQSDPHLAGWVLPTTDWSHVCKPGNAQFEMSCVNRIDAPLFLAACRQYFKDNGMLIQGSVAAKDVRASASAVTWQGLSAKHMIFCQGAVGEGNPFFPELEFRNVQGHVLKVVSPHLPNGTIFNHGKWLCPTTPGEFLYGASTVRHDSDAPIKLAELRASLRSFLNVKAHIIGTVLGVRPCLKHAHPMAFFSRQYTRIGCINGFRGQGMFYAPIMASWMYGQLLESARITFPEALKYQKLDDLKRYPKFPNGMDSKPRLYANHVG